MSPSSAARKQLEISGLIIRKFVDAYAIIKPLEVSGNALPNYQTAHLADIQGNGGIISDCPMITWRTKEELISLEHWAYVPGPGPGDFELTFDAESEAVEFLLSYFFGENPHFQDKVTDQIHRRNSYNLEDVSRVTSEVLNTLIATFGSREFDWERGPYYRLPVDKFWIQKAEPEFPQLNGETGFMGYTAMMLRRKVHEKRVLDWKDVGMLADIFRHLSLEMKEIADSPSDSE